MWIRLRLDITWAELLKGLFVAFRPGSRTGAQKQLEAHWSRDRNDALACLSVRSGFDLLLRTLKLPAGSEILFSAITVPTMPEIAVRHGLVPVPIDVCGSDFQIDRSSLLKGVTPRSRVLVISHLLGARPEIAELIEIAREQHLLVVEDCAQAWCGLDWRGTEQADISLFSFGPIKTATAFGGALCRVGDPELLAQMRSIQETDAVQSQASFLFKCFKFAFLKALSARLPFTAVIAFARLFGMNADVLLGSLTRGFPKNAQLDHLRKQPSAPLLRLLDDRLAHYDGNRIPRRIRNARSIIEALGLSHSQPELFDARHTFWIFPLITPQPSALISHLRKSGFDITQRGRMEVIPAPAGRLELDCPHATQLLREMVFLPCYPDLTEAAIHRMCREIQRCHGRLRVGIAT